MVQEIVRTPVCARIPEHVRPPTHTSRKSGTRDKTKRYSPPADCGKIAEKDVRAREVRVAKRGNRRRASRQQKITLPAIDALHDLPAFCDLRLDDAQRAAFEGFLASAENAGEMALGFVVRLDRGFPLIVTADDAFRAEHSVAFAKQDAGKDEGLLPVVGDCVAVRRAPGHDMGVIERVLPRRTSFERWRGRSRGERQVLAANVDAILIVQPLGAGELLLGRVARSLVLARDCGLEPVVVLTKADRAADDELEQEVARVRRLVGEEVRVIVTSSATGAGVEEVRACVPPLSCAMILGESGAGKSTLLNALLGHEALATGEVRERDDAGRHTTVSRVMVRLPGAGVIADVPGLRSLPLVGHERGLAKTFPEIADAAQGCRFRDCTHTHEPGCAVRDHYERGAFSEERLSCYLALADEMRKSALTLDPDIVI